MLPLNLRASTDRAASLAALAGGVDISQYQLAQLCQQTCGAQYWDQTILEAVSKPREKKKKRTEGCCLKPCENITRDDRGSCAA